MLQRRTRLISLRTTEEEYECIHEASATHGSRSVSDFARAVLIGEARRFQFTGKEAALATECPCSRLNDLERRVVQIEAELRDGRTPHRSPISSEAK